MATVGLVEVVLHFVITGRHSPHILVIPEFHNCRKVAPFVWNGSSATLMLQKTVWLLWKQACTVFWGGVYDSRANSARALHWLVQCGLFSQRAKAMTTGRMTSTWELAVTYGRAIALKIRLCDVCLYSPNYLLLKLVYLVYLSYMHVIVSSN